MDDILKWDDITKNVVVEETGQRKPIMPKMTMKITSSPGDAPGIDSYSSEYVAVFRVGMGMYASPTLGLTVKERFLERFRHMMYGWIIEYVWRLEERIYEGDTSGALEVLSELKNQIRNSRRD